MTVDLQIFGGGFDSGFDKEQQQHPFSHLLHDRLARYLDRLSGPLTMTVDRMEPVDAVELRSQPGTVVEISFSDGIRGNIYVPSEPSREHSRGLQLLLEQDPFDSLPDPHFAIVERRFLLGALYPIDTTETFPPTDSLELDQESVPAVRGWVRDGESWRHSVLPLQASHEQIVELTREVRSVLSLLQP